ncbi:mitotic checkpoint regulator, MAD2B-interacting-domain-containing protein [Stachybotrys elegans]|uniref:Mitotic checkpoint regulator, MAD2B-interacting-domain-containing protein n=1 Tax=Stachybotrys elegans TaxID=80388 RepID=A0A8K0SN15_9HYPO|nr:mitotic checkpoint regulator, MAD2B-interacting-domain-containing protein [Stachybotrys elegans]
MGLVDYSESDSSDVEVEAAPKAPASASTATSGAKRPFQKVVDRSNPGKIVLNLPRPSAEGGSSDGQPPPTKRAKTGASGLFSGFNSFLPPPKNANKATPAATAAKVRPGVNLKTSAAPGFSRESAGFPEEASRDEDGSSAGMTLPPPKNAEPRIPEGQKSEEDVKLVGKPLMFKPLSVGRNANKKKSTKIMAGSMPAAAPAGAKQPDQSAATSKPGTGVEPAPPKKKMSLFSMHTEEESEPAPSHRPGGTYQPMFETEDQDPAYAEYAQWASQAQTGPVPTVGSDGDSLDNIANDLNLTAAQKRELFGRGGSGHAVKKVVNFNMDQEYKHNEDLRAAGEQQIHNPVRAIQAAGKNSLRQLVQNARSQKDALEDSFAQNRSKRKEASGRYGW